jgi:hypothetical protein
MAILRPSSALLCIAALVCPVALAAESHQAAALWLSLQLHRPVTASQVLVSPSPEVLAGCAILRTRSTSVGAIALSLRCQAQSLPQLVLLALPVEFASPHAAALPPAGAPAVPPIVRAGAELRADLRTANLHAELPVVALASGAVGAEIRVRISRSNRILRARILGAHSVSIVAAGV